MMKRMYVLGGLVLVLAALSGCSDKYEKDFSENVTVFQSQSEENTVDGVTGSSGDNNETISDNPTEENKSSLDISFAKAESSLDKKYIRFDENKYGFYRIGTMGDNILNRVECNRIYYFDYASGVGQLLCNDINCGHDNADCSACLLDSDYYCNYIFCDNDNLYLVAKKDDGAYLEKAELDGSNRKICVKLWETNSAIPRESDMAFLNLMLRSGDYIYYFVNEDYMKLSLYSVSLTDYSVTRLYYEEVSGEDMVGNDSEFFITDKNIVFSVENYSMGKRDRKIIAVNKEDLSQTASKLNTVYFGSHGDYIYYSQPNYTDNILAYNMKTGEEMVAIDKNKGENEQPVYYYIICTDNYILLDNDMAKMFDDRVTKRIFEIYDYSYNLISTIEIPDRFYLEYYDEAKLTFVQKKSTAFDDYCIMTFDENMNVLSIDAVPDLGFEKPEGY